MVLSTHLKNAQEHGLRNTQCTWGGSSQIHCTLRKACAVSQPAVFSQCYCEYCQSSTWEAIAGAERSSPAWVLFLTCWHPIVGLNDSLLNVWCFFFSVMTSGLINRNMWKLSWRHIAAHWGFKRFFAPHVGKHGLLKASQRNWVLKYAKVLKLNGAMRNQMLLYILFYSALFYSILIIQLPQSIHSNSSYVQDLPMHFGLFFNGISQGKIKNNI